MELAALETVYTLHPEQDRLLIYTDGSVRDRNGNTGAANCPAFICCLDNMPPILMEK
jgi:hypothetical protein